MKEPRLLLPPAIDTTQRVHGRSTSTGNGPLFTSLNLVQDTAKWGSGWIRLTLLDTTNRAATVPLAQQLNREAFKQPLQQPVRSPTPAIAPPVMRHYAGNGPGNGAGSWKEHYLADGSMPRVLSETSFPKNKIRVLLLENIHQSAIELFNQQGFQVETVPGALSLGQLKEKIEKVHVLGIRSKTKVPDEAMAAAKRLLCIGCFCIGTNQVELEAANKRGVPVFNAPFSNTRSVAELVICEIIALARKMTDSSRQVHQGIWRKISKGCFEVRGKTLGIVGYGHIGSQVGIMAEMLGMKVIFYDAVAKLPLGNSQSVRTLDVLLHQADFVTLHVPAISSTRNMMSAAQLAIMKPHSYLINASRGSVVQIPDLAAALQSKHLAGAALDVYPQEPEGNTEKFVTEMQGLDNVILTPHIAGSTEEAQEAIGREVASALIKFINCGATSGAVNFPQVDLPASSQKHRILNVHQNVPGVLRDINMVVGNLEANIGSMVNMTDSNIGYCVIDLDQDVSHEVEAALIDLPTNIRTRIVYAPTC